MTDTVKKIIAVLAVVAVVLALLGIRSCMNNANRAAQGRMDGEQLKAGANSARDAINTQGQANVRERNSEDLTRTNEEEIRNAQGSDVVVHPDANDAGLRALCRRASYRDTERCKLRNPPAR